MALGQEITIKTTLGQHLTQQQIQLIKMLEIPALEMEARVLQEIDDNPALEYGEDPESTASEEELGNEEPAETDEFPQDETDENNDDAAEEKDESDSNDTGSDGYGDEGPDDYGNEDDRDEMEEYIADYDDKAADFGRTQPADADDRREPYSGVQTDSLQEYLKQQLSNIETTEIQELIGEYIIGNIDSDGYLRADAQTIADQVTFQNSKEVEAYQVEQMLEKIQEFEPAGVAAKDLQECLLLQLERRNQTREVELAHDVLEQYFTEFSDRDYHYICQQIDITQEDMDAVIKEVTRLTPKPGNAWEASQLTETGRQITPDFLVENHDGKLEVTLNDTTIPDLHISRAYLQMWQDFQATKKRKGAKSALYDSRKEGALYAKKKIDAANWFIQAIQQRQNTLLNTMQAIVDHQQAFFLTGEEKKLKPMKLKDIAAATGLDVSTISRVSNCKFAQTEMGIFPLKYFFSESMQNESGEEVSVKEIQSTIKDIVASEDKSNPYTDDALVELLKGKGYPIARRTVAKYRDLLRIPSSKERKIQISNSFKKY